MAGIRLGDGSVIEATIEGTGPAVLLPVDPTPVEGDRAVELRKWGVDPALGRRLVDGLSDRFRVVAFDYEGHLFAHPKPDTLTPGTIAADFLTVADAAGADRFAYYGYSWLALAGLQLALRTDRLSALVMGGYPPLDGPYEEMLAVTAAGHDQAVEVAERTATRRAGVASADAASADAASADAAVSDWSDPADFDWSSVEISLTEEQTRQYLTLYRELQGFDDRAIQDRLTIPRLCFAGSADAIDYGERWGDVRVDLAGPLVRERDTLERLGWQVRVLEGLDHTSAMQPDAVLPVIRPWLSANFSDSIPADVENRPTAPTPFRVVSDRAPRLQEEPMKYMIMMFGSAESMMETKTPEWVREMIAYMIQLDKDLADAGELVYNEGLADPGTAKTVRLVDGAVTATDGPFAEAKESVIGFWIVDVESEARLLEIAESIVKYSDVVEVRPVPSGPPEV